MRKVHVVCNEEATWRMREEASQGNCQAEKNAALTFRKYAL